MTRSFSHGLTLIGQIALGYVFLSCISASAAIGIYEFSATSTSTTKAQIQYRLNCPGQVTVCILDSNDRVVKTMGPFDETAGLQTHDWDGTGANAGTGTYQACIRATSPGSSIDNHGKLERLCGATVTKGVYGLVIDRFAESPGYGTIYVSDVANQRIRAYHADGSVKTEFGSGGYISLGFTATPKSAPKGIGVDKLGQIYTACSISSTGKSGVKVFDYSGKEIEPYHVFASQAQGNYWLDGLIGPQGPEIYESYNDEVRACAIGDADWHTAIPAIAGTTTKQICFETSGNACYVATYSPTAGTVNPGVTRYVRTDGQWTQDSSFDCQLGGLIAFVPASQYAIGVSCDGRPIGAPSSYGATSLWMALDAAYDMYGGNIVRKNLADNSLTLFASAAGKGRFVAADSVGNVALESGQTTDAYWSMWGLYAPGGEASEDTRTTGSFAIAGVAPTAKTLDNVTDMKSEASGTAIELSAGKTVTAAFDGCFYIADSEHSAGIRVISNDAVAQGSLVRVKGTLDMQNGERVLKDAVILTP